MTRTSKRTSRRMSKRTFTPAVVLTLAAFLLLPLATTGAQGTLSVLGFGYPVGGLSTRAVATGGAFGEFDAISPRNPAALGGLPRTVIAVQTEPEYRTLRIGGLKESTTAQRVPLLLLAFPARNRVSVSLSATTFLDRSYSTATTGTVVVDGVTLPTRDSASVRGSIGDLRAAIGWRLNDRLSVGVGGHLFTGDNLVARSRSFADSSVFGNVVDSSRVTFFGHAVSVGTELQIVKGLAASASYRAGGKLEARVSDTVRSRANVPDRIGVALRYDAVPGAIFAVGLEQQRWSDMQGLGSSLVETHDATNWHAGAEVAGPRFMGSVLQLRAGYAQGTLPFGADGRTVKESRITGGFGLPLARDFASLDFSLQRALRSLSGGPGRESAWLLGVGIQIRPGGP